MSVPVLIGVVVGVLVIGGLVGAVLLYALASGEGGPSRFSAVQASQGFFDKGASFAVTAQITVPGPVERVWALVAQGGYLDGWPLITGPTRAGDVLTVRTPLLALSEKVVHEDGEEFVAIGTGLSVPIVLKSFGERWRLAADKDKVVVQWTVALTPRWIGWLPLRWTAFAVRPFLTEILALALR
ncbi:MAG: SRPBCC family protein [Mycobacterium sp.]